MGALDGTTGQDYTGALDGTTGQDYTGALDGTRRKGSMQVSIEQVSMGSGAAPATHGPCTGASNMPIYGNSTHGCAHIRHSDMPIPRGRTRHIQQTSGVIMHYTYIWSYDHALCPYMVDPN